MKKIILALAALLAVTTSAQAAPATTQYDLGVFVGATTLLTPASATSFTLGIDALYKLQPDMGLGIFWRLPLGGGTSMDLGAEYKLWLDSVTPGFTANAKAGLGGIGSGAIGFLIAAGAGYEVEVAPAFKVGAGLDFILGISSAVSTALQYGANATYSF